jgi:hypothetical protein
LQCVVRADIDVGIRIPDGAPTYVIDAACEALPRDE